MRDHVQPVSAMEPVRAHGEGTCPFPTHAGERGPTQRLLQKDLARGTMRGQRAHGEGKGIGECTAGSPFHPGKTLGDPWTGIR